MDEFALIELLRPPPGAARADVRLGMGDDGAVLVPPPACELVAATDLLVAGRHFPEGTDPEALGHKALAVNLSDLAAMGAEPAWALLQLSLPEADGDFVAAFARGFHRLAGEHRVALVGGDTVRGPLAVGVTVLGWVAAGGALTRAGARPGHRIYVTGSLGDAALGLACRQGGCDLPGPLRDQVVERLERPRPRLAAGRALAPQASAGIDISDGLPADLGHLLAASGCGARLQAAELPWSEAGRAFLAAGGDRRLLLEGGDDYELCLTVAPERERALCQIARELAVPLTCIGTVEAEPGIRLAEADGGLQDLPAAGYRHFP